MKHVTAIEHGFPTKTLVKIRSREEVMAETIALSVSDCPKPIEGRKTNPSANGVRQMRG